MNTTINENPADGTDKNAQLEYLMRRFGKQVFRLAYYYLRDMHLAEDIYQEVFIKVYRNLERFRKESSYYTWIYRITVNLCKDYLKSSAFKRLVTAGLSDDWYRSAMRTNKLFEEIEGGEIFSMVMNLPKKYRIPISLYYFDGFSVAEIAGIMKISESNVKVRLYRGRKLLKDSLPLEVVK